MGLEKVMGSMYAKAFQPFSFQKGTQRVKAPSISTAHRSSAVEIKVLPIRSIAEKAAISRLQTMIFNIRYNGAAYGPDLAVKAFSDLNSIFFAGKLGRNVCVNWSSHTFDPQLHCAEIPWATVWGVTAENQHPSEYCQCRIILNAGSLFGSKVMDPLAGMMSTLLHEMCHAYDIVRCVPTAEGCGGDRFGHDLHFETRIVAVRERAMWIMGLGAISEGEPFQERRYFVTDAIAKD